MNKSFGKENGTIICNIGICFSYSNKVLSFNRKIHLYEGNKCNISEILDKLPKEIYIKNKVISVYDKEFDSFIYCGIYPTKSNILFKVDISLPLIQIKLRNIFNKTGLLRTELLEEGENENIDERQTNMFINEKSKRAKERKIGDIIKKVYMWRKLYFGYINENGIEIKLSLEEAAEKIGISKKSLDDYLIQLRIGKMFGFNFNEHKNDKVGILRAFVKKNKSYIENKFVSTDFFDSNKF